MRKSHFFATLAVAGTLVVSPVLASSHREAPGITKLPKIDATDFYLFNSYETGRAGYVTMIANYVPLQAPYGGPNYFQLDPDAIYEIKVDNNGDAVEDVTFQFRFGTQQKNISLQIGADGAKKSIAVPLINVGPITAGNNGALNVVETYSVDVLRRGKKGQKSKRDALTNVSGGDEVFIKPVDNIGNKSLPNYESYANQYVYDVAIPGCGEGRMFVGQRKDPFVVNLGETFDLVNIANPVGDRDAETDDLDDANVTSLILEVPSSCLTEEGKPIIGAWTTASLRRSRILQADGGDPARKVEAGGYVQLSRLSAPLVNEVVIGLKDKDKFNSSEPKNDGQFADYVTHPTLPALIEILFNVPAPTLFPRTDLVQAFLTGLPGLNQNGSVAEMLRLNTDVVAIPPKPRGQQSSLGALGGDLAGFPNGRRPGDDVVDIELRVAMGALINDANLAPAGQAPFTDGAIVDDSFFDAAFPYLRAPLAGSPAN